MTDYIDPVFRKAGFNCPHCGAHAHQTWSKVAYYVGETDEYTTESKTFSVSICFSCEQVALWNRARLIYPITSLSAPRPNPDLPEEIQADYNEARSIASLSPRGAAALLRLAIQKLCIHLGEPGKNLNEDIAKLVKKGLHEDVQQMLDAVRVIGNNAVHPGEIDIHSDLALVQSLFSIVNEIADEMITRPKRRREIYNLIPEEERKKSPSGMGG